MPRSVELWIGKTDDSMPTDAVRRRICERQGWVCACGCTRVMDYNTDSIDIDHIVPLVDEGENQETNLQAMLHEHHVVKTSLEATQRAQARQHQAKAFTRPPSKWQSQGFPPARPKRRATTPIEPAFEGDLRGRTASDVSPAIFTPKE